MNNYVKTKLVLSLLIIVCDLFGQQLNIAVIEKMPNKPEPYLMRNWKGTAVGYDSFVFNFQAAGQYLPLGNFYSNTVNYTNHGSFRLHTVVGTESPSSAEAINCLPAVIGASLVGIDKTNQNGNNYVLMCEEWFNKRPEQNVYKNHPVDDTADDWWYETMPNVFFYQLYSLYPNTGDFSNQFVSVADQWLTAVIKMGGSTTPWHVPYMNYRGWDLSTMLPYPSGVTEPEAAGAIGWILYNAYKVTGEEKYKNGAEWCLEYLNSLSTNPSYELQLAYGVYSAARMNAEIGTNYDVPKLLNWCFSVGRLRNWGVITGKWGSYDVNGLVGEVNGSNDYAFAMNTFEQIGALVPLVRYDERFARAIGKWVLNAANSSRLFYTKYLPDNYQDSEEWAHQYDAGSYLAHEAIRQEKYGSSPYATGDAIDGGWGKTNLALYGSSHIGILGGIIDTTNVEMILKLDLLKTDYFAEYSFPSYLIYNPYETEKTIHFNAGSGIHDLYNVITNDFILKGITGEIELSIPADSPVIVVVVPSGGNMIYELNKTLLNGVVIDYNNENIIENYPPRIKSLSAESLILLQGQSTKIYCTGWDKESATLAYQWTATKGSLSDEGPTVTFTAPDETGEIEIQCIVKDDSGSSDTAQLIVNITDLINNSPSINTIVAHPRKIDLNSETKISCLADDPDNDELFYSWYSDSGTIIGEGSEIYWQSPATEGNYFIKCSVSDSHGAAVIDSIEVMVRDFSVVQSGDLIAFYPFNGNADDGSGNSLNGSVSGASLTKDRFNNSSCAFLFDGVNDYIVVKNNDLLNFQNAITVSFWIQADEFFEREAYPISHGNWENRWKISITNKKIRWTVKTLSGIKDLDSETELVKGQLYHVAAIYSGKDFELYLNGELDAFSSLSGAIAKTNIDLTIGQALPGNNQYNFKGVLDEVRIYNYALPYDEVAKLYDISTSVEEPDENNIPGEFRLIQNYPNPFNPSSNIKYQIVKTGKVNITVYNLLGEEVMVLVNQEQKPGYYNVEIDGSGLSSGVYIYKLSVNEFVSVKKMMLLK